MVLSEKTCRCDQDEEEEGKKAEELRKVVEDARQRKRAEFDKGKTREMRKGIA